MVKTSEELRPENTPNEKSVEFKDVRGDAMEMNGKASSRRKEAFPECMHGGARCEGEPESPRRRELLGHIAANFAAVAFHAFGRLPDGIGDEEIRALSRDIEKAAHNSTAGIEDADERKQAYYAAASKKLLEVVLNHCPPDADLTACQTLPPPQLEPLSPLQHVARPPMDPRFNAPSPFAHHTEEPSTPPLGGRSHRRRGVGFGNEPACIRTGSLPSPTLQMGAAASAGCAESPAGALSYARSESIMSTSREALLGGREVCRQMSLTLRQANRQQMLSLGSLGRSSGNAWGYLEPTDASLPPVLLEGPGLVIGRSREGFEARRHALSMATSQSGAILDPSPPRRLAEVLAMALGFLEIEDGRISRMHCLIQATTIQGLPFQGPGHSPAAVEDHSINGTFLNGMRLPKGERRPLSDGDTIAVVLSPSPMLEKSYIVRFGDPHHEAQLAEMQWADTAPSTLCNKCLEEDGAEEPAAHTPEGRKLRHSLSNRRGLKRMATSRYTTAESSEPGDLMCQICLGPLRSCVALRPCGHNFCAACLSHHFAHLLQGGQALVCPLRCAAAEQVVINFTMRRLVSEHFPVARNPSTEGCQGSKSKPADSTSELERLPWQSLPKSNQQRRNSCQPNGSRDEPTEGSIPLVELEDAETDADDVDCDDSDLESGELTEMASTCPLWDAQLPMEIAGLKTQQVEVALRELQQTEIQRLLSALETLARLAWNDDEVRTVIAMRGGIQMVVALMRSLAGEAPLLCNACLCLMSLVRGEGPTCEANQWQVAKAGGVEAVVACMGAFAQDAVVQLSALLCLIPLALDNSSLQAHVATLALPAVVAALRTHVDHADVQAKGLVVLGVLGQGEEAVHDAIRQQQLAVGATGRILASLKHWAAQNEEVLWAVLFSLAVLVRDGAQPFQPAIRAVAAAGIPQLLTAALQSYKDAGGADDMILTAGDYLLKTLAPAAARVTRERYGVAGLAMAPVVAASLWAWRNASRW